MVVRPETRPGGQLSRLRDALWHPTAAGVRMLALLGVIANAGIIVSGGAVRLSQSGLGCPSWPKCTGDSLVPNRDSGHAALNMAIEFGNRTLTFLVLAAGVAVLIAAVRLTPRRRDLVRLAALQPLGVVAQAVWGGVTVLTKLHPATVAAHYMLSIAILVAAYALYARAGEGDDAPRPLVSPRLRALAFVLTGAVVALLTAGTIVTGTGPHAGDSAAPRFGFGIEEVARVHGELAWLTVGLTVALIVALRRTGAPAQVRRRASALFLIELAQGAIGYTQYFLGVPALLVGLHMLGSAVLWLATLHVLFATRTRGRAAEPAEPVTPVEPSTAARPA
ncbi:MAG TPA: COX15/CtaA family protein [Streptosporangiaceae bacterium]